MTRLAAAASSEVYGDLSKVAADWKLEHNSLSNLKAVTISVDETDNKRVLTVAVRGSVTRRDWMANTNLKPTKSTTVGDDQAN